MDNGFCLEHDPLIAGSWINTIPNVSTTAVPATSLNTTVDSGLSTVEITITVIAVAASLLILTGLIVYCTYPAVRVCCICISTRQTEQLEKENMEQNLSAAKSKTSCPAVCCICVAVAKRNFDRVDEVNSAQIERAIQSKNKFCPSVCCTCFSKRKLKQWKGKNNEQISKTTISADRYCPVMYCICEPCSKDNDVRIRPEQMTEREISTVTERSGLHKQTKIHPAENYINSRVANSTEKRLSGHSDQAISATSIDVSAHVTESYVDNEVKLTTNWMSH